MHRYAIALAALAVSLAVRADDKGTVTEIDGLKSTAPANWKSEKPATPERVYQFTIPKAEGDKDDAMLLVFYFPGGGGGVQANIQRWKTMIHAAEGAKDEDTYKTTEFKVGDVKVTQFEASGTYVFKRRPFDPNDKGELKPDYKFIGVIFESPKGPYFMRMVGPKKTMEANRKAFDEWLKNFK